MAAQCFRFKEPFFKTNFEINLQIQLYSSFVSIRRDDLDKFPQEAEIILFTKSKKVPSLKPMQIKKQSKCGLSWTNNYNT